MSFRNLFRDLMVGTFRPLFPKEEPDGDFLVQEDGFNFLLEDGSGSILLEGS